MRSSHTPSIWASSNGGPLIAVEAGNLRHWLGIEPPTDGRVIDTEFRWTGDPDASASDYDRACDITDYKALLKVEHGYGLVLPEPAITAWWPVIEKQSGYLVRWGYAEDQNDVQKWMSVVPELPTVEEALEWMITDPRIYLFDSAYSGQDVLDGMSDDFLVFELLPGRYTVSTALYQPDNSTLFVLHRIEPILYGRDD